MMRKIFFILIVVVLFACNAEKSESKGIKSNPNLKMYGKSFWKDKPFVTYTLASDLFPVRDFNEIVLDPVLRYDSNGGFGIRLLAEMTTKNKEGKADLFSHGTDVVAKIMDNNDVILFNENLFIDSISKKDPSLLFVSSKKAGTFPIFLTSHFDLNTSKRMYEMFMVKFNLDGDRYVLKKIDPFNLTKSLIISGCKENKCSVSAFGMLGPEGSFSLKPQCNWISFSPLPLPNKENGFLPKSVGFLEATKEGACKIKSKIKGGILISYVVSVRRGNYYHLYLKPNFHSLLENEVYPPYPENNIAFDMIDRYLKLNQMFENDEE